MTNMLRILLLATLVFAPRVLGAQASTDAKAIVCRERCAPIHNQWGELTGWGCELDPSAFGGQGYNCQANAYGCTIATIGCDWVEVMNTTGEPIWSGRKCEPLPLDPTRLVGTARAAEVIGGMLELVATNS